ncbi:MAG: uridylate kinase, partial [Candidatus Poseidoniaceae archaeon]
MRDTVVVKWGGGLITNKSVPCTPDLDIMSKLANVLSTYVAEGNDVILVHGAGSYGHLKAKQHRIHLGYSGDEN